MSALSLSSINYGLAALLFLIGVYGILARIHLVRKLMAMNILQVAVIVFFITLAYKTDATPPIRALRRRIARGARVHQPVAAHVDAHRDRRQRQHYRSRARASHPDISPLRHSERDRASREAEVTLHHHAPILILLVPLAAALVIPLLALSGGRGARATTLAAVLGSLYFAVACLRESLDTGPMHYHLAGWEPPWGIEVVLDPLSGIMASLVAGLGLLAAVYAGPYLGGWTARRACTFYSVYCLLVVGLQGIVITGDMFNLYVFLEISSLAAYALLSKGGSKSIVAVFRYLLIGTLAASFYLIGVGYLYALTGTLNMADLASRMPADIDSAVLVVAASFIVIGLAIKSALFPLHGWLPDAYTYAPGPVVGFIAAVMAKVSAYALYRILYFVFDAQVGPREPIVLLGWASVIAVVAGSLMALAQKDVQRMLAYSSIGQMGYIILGIAIGTPLALTGALLHVIAHAVMKGCLFMAVNGVEWKLGVFRVSDFAGVGKRLPLTMAAFTVAAMSMIGLPPTAGFFSKYYLVLAALESNQIPFLVALIVSSLLGAVYFFRVIERAYLMSGDDSQGERRDLPAAMLVPILTLAALVLLFGVLNQTIVTEVVVPGLPS